MPQYPDYSKCCSFKNCSRKVAESLRKDTFLKENLSVVTFRTVGVLGSKFISFSSLFPKEDKATASGKTFLETEEAETLLEECLAIQWVWGLPLKYTHLPALELALEGKLDESGDSPTHLELSWRSGGSTDFLLICLDFLS